MFKKFQTGVLTHIALMLTFVAGLGVSTNSAFIIYEPDVPNCLKK
ncbi:MAG: cyclic lactone autoinducer peptide [Syntrophomonadaceae bacterium]|nr:cyclic lactone autoinducer peptide [Syntrophomonadaceae bacterium]MDD4550181.1 cyclic lactone autoinducer peptide [Syntrophomonadaceae bacterium]